MNVVIDNIIETYDELPEVQSMSRKHCANHKAKPGKKNIDLSRAYSMISSLMEGRSYEKVSKSIRKILHNISEDSRNTVMSAIYEGIEDLLEKNPRKFYEMSRLKEEYPNLRINEFEVKHMGVGHGFGLFRDTGFDRNKGYEELLKEAHEERYSNITAAINNYTNQAIGNERIRFDFYDKRGKKRHYVDFPNAQKAKLSRNDITSKTARIDLNVFNEEKGNYTIRFEFRDEYLYETSKDVIKECDGEKALDLRMKNPLKELHLVPVYRK